ncbi:thiamine pyrophosphate-binding protein [Dyadobacter chenhuakuii]|uniref:Thiamine pyrophosphate-binding protein n=1 Tax=Dyadobacter chenhuakuii TaxID=2909339 RepID=A0ABY4XNR0_9BACT|nr:thiamine pyrophosphate-binding protein [Dyadobacter chenhuakuii]MCF2494648.1 thiamine pyrophosphate-binding protein [Dyadobacter chenhuakuii]USJ32030.1 thiamine pyrophosphate-binding protein [Dyadobacter chenhuakuii]
MAGKTGNQKIIEQFLADGMDYMFGNPGTVEQGFLDALAEYPDMKYILTLQETIAVMMGDGYARATQKPTLVQLHSSPGIGNAVGAVYQAKRGHAPLVVIGSDAGVQYMNMDAQMANDLVAMMAPVTKYSTMATSSKSLLRTLRRAVKIASTPPMGPVYVCLPMDVLDEINDEPVFPSCIPSTRVSPAPELIRQSAEMLLAAEKPIIFVGDGIAYSDAIPELTHVAELLGAEVYGVEFGDLVMDNTHPLYQGTTGHMFGSFSHPITTKGDANLIVGTYMMPEVFPELGEIYAPEAKVIHFDLNAYEIAKNHRVDLGVVSDPKLSLAALAQEIEAVMSAEQKAKAQQRIEQIGNAKNARIAAEKEADDQQQGKSPLHMSQFTKVLAEKLNQDETIIFDEALTSSAAVSRYLPPTLAKQYFFTRGGSLGVGFPGAIGAKIANPEKTVIGFSGDGGSMYTIQTLWSAVRHNTGAKFVVCNNGSYKLLQLNIDQYWQEREIPKHDHPLPFDLSYPAIRFDILAQSMGVEAVRVEKEEEILPAIERMLADDKPFLIDLVLEGSHKSDWVKTNCSQ